MFRPKRLKINNITTHVESIYEFRTGKPVLIVGDNKDDPSQRGNGAGKSGFIEGIAIAVTGSPVRDVTNREIVKNGEEFGEVELVLYNTMYRCELRIWRRIYSSNKPAEVKVYENDEEMVAVDVNEYNKLIFSYFGISKEDFFSFYLLTRSSYEPFLAVGDTKKKNIINRFSGAESVDSTKSYVDVDINEAQSSATSIEKQIGINIGKRQIINDQIEAERKSSNKEEAVKELQDEIDRYIAIASEKIVHVSELQIKVNEKERELVDEDKLSEECELLDEKRHEVWVKRNEIHSNLQEALQLMSELNIHIAGEIECPVCASKFTLDNEFDIEEARKNVIELDGLIKELTETYNAADEEQLTLAGQVGKCRVEIVNVKKSNLLVQREIKELRKEVEREEELIEKYVDKAEKCEREIDELRCKEESTRVTELEKQLSQYIREWEELKVELQIAVDKVTEIKEWTTNFKNFKSFLANQSIANVEDYTNMYMQSMGSNISIKIAPYKELSRNRGVKDQITIDVLRDGIVEGSYGKFSGGERARIDVAVILAIQSLININASSGGLDLTLIDEVLDSVDALGLEYIMKGLECVGRTVMIVSQVDVSAESVMVIRKKDKISTIV